MAPTLVSKISQPFLEHVRSLQFHTVSINWCPPLYIVLPFLVLCWHKYTLWSSHVHLMLVSHSLSGLFFFWEFSFLFFVFFVLVSFIYLLSILSCISLFFIYKLFIWPLLRGCTVVIPLSCLLYPLSYCLSHFALLFYFMYSVIHVGIHILY